MNDSQEIRALDERLKRIETLQRNTRIAIIIIVGFLMYDALAPDSGSDIVFAHKVKARQFELVDGAGTVFGYWRKTDDGNDSRLQLDNTDGSHLAITSDAFTWSGGGADAVETGVRLTPEGMVTKERKPETQP